VRQHPDVASGRAASLIRPQLGPRFQRARYPHQRAEPWPLARLERLWQIIVGGVFNGCPFRKCHPEIAPHPSWFKFPVRAYKFPVLLQKFPVLLSREFRCKPLNLLACQRAKLCPGGEFDEIPC
jgi:hypothetical protein